jgi:hypothetical protein
VIRTRGLVAAAVPLLVLLMLAIAQLVLPGIAAHQLREELSRHGRVLDVEVDAFPAIELLWHQADRVVIRMASYSSSGASLEQRVGQVAEVGSLDASAGVLTAGLLKLRNASLHKRGDQLTGEATVTEADLRASLPVLDSVIPVTSGGGQLTLQGTATLFGVTATIDATVRPDAGSLVVAPDVPFGALATITLFSSPHVLVSSVSASPVPGGFEASVQAAIR